MEENILELKRCEQCGELKDKIKDYYWSNNRTRKICKDCVKANEKLKYSERITEWNNYKKSLKCKKCGETKFYILEFHHTDPSEKEFTISDHNRTSIKILKKEIEKCDVLCCNCHREWHYLKDHIDISYEEWINNNVENNILEL